MNKPTIIVGGQPILYSPHLYDLIVELREERRQIEKLINSMAEALADYDFQHDNDELICPGCPLYLNNQCFKSNTVADDNCLERIVDYFKRNWIIHKGEED